jgi:hypothetical protein
MDNGGEPEVAPEYLNQNDMIQGDLEELEVEPSYEKKVLCVDEIAFLQHLKFVFSRQGRFYIDYLKIFVRLSKIVEFSLLTTYNCSFLAK